MQLTPTDGWSKATAKFGANNLSATISFDNGVNLTGTVSGDCVSIEWENDTVFKFVPQPPSRRGAPTLTDLSPPARRDMPLLSAPVVQNFYGAVSLRHDMLSLGAMAWSPYNGNFQNGSFSVDGFNADVDTTRWSACEGLRSGVAGTVAIANAVRMPFEDYAFQQTWLLSSADSSPHAILANFDGPYFRFCDVDGQGACGWGTTFPIDRANFALSLVDVGGGVTAMLTIDHITGVTTASTVWFRNESSGGTVALSVDTSNNTFWVNATFSSPVVVLQQVGDVGRRAAARSTRSFTAYRSQQLATQRQTPCHA